MFPAGREWARAARYYSETAPGRDYALAALGTS